MAAAAAEGESTSAGGGSGDTLDVARSQRPPLNAFLPPLQLRHGLFVSRRPPRHAKIAIDTLQLSLDTDRLNLRNAAEPKLTHRFTCGRLMRRNEQTAHSFFHLNLDRVEAARFRRCDLGCGFGVERLVPTVGVLRFVRARATHQCAKNVSSYEPFFDSIIHRHDDEEATPLVGVISEWLWAFVLRWRSLSVVEKCANSAAYSQIARYLDGASLNALAATSKSMRATIFAQLGERCVVWRRWQKTRKADGQVNWRMLEQPVIKAENIFSQNFFCFFLSFV